MRRVVVTGMGLVSPLGCGVSHNWNLLINSKSGIDRIQSFDVSDLRCKIAGQIPLGIGEGELNIEKHVDVKDQRKMDLFIIYALAAAAEAVKDSEWMPTDPYELERTGVTVGSGIGGLEGIYQTSITLFEKGPKRVTPFFIPSCLINLASGQISIKYGFRGPNHAVVTACSSGAHAIGDAARFIQFDNADVMIAGGTESTVCRIGIAGFAAARALSTSFNETPEKASRPWDKERDGFVMGEGSGILVLEELEHAKKRNAKIYGELIGYGVSGDAHHMTAPAEDGRGAYLSMKSAFKSAKINPDEVGYINAHGTSTPLGDEIELNAVKKLLKDNVKNISMSSTKSSIGHLLGAAGSVEAIYSLLAIKENILPPTLNLENPSEGCNLDLVPNTSKEKQLKIALSNSFGFGGTNASLIFSEFY